MRSQYKHPNPQLSQTESNRNTNMGNNHSLCCFLTKSNPKKAMLVDANGKLHKLYVPMMAAELMLEAPGFIISAVDEIIRTGRVVAMGADSEILAGKTYLVLPVNRMNCKVTENELSLIKSACKAKYSSSRKKSKAENLMGASGEERDKGEDACMLQVEEGNKDARLCSQQLHSYSYRLWNPVLETILEEN